MGLTSDKMRHKLSITIDQDTILKINDLMRSKKYRNKSHFFELAAAKMLDEEKEVDE